MAKRGRPRVDPRKVELVKALREMGKTYPYIAKQTGLSLATVKRYAVREDNEVIEPQLVDARQKHRTKYVDDAWKIIHDLNQIVKKMVDEEAFKSVKEAAIVQAIYVDKVQKLSAPPRSPDRTQNITFILQSNLDDPDKGRFIANPIEVSPVKGEVQGDDSRGGGGKNVLALPRGGEGEPGGKDERDDSSQ